MLLIFRLFFFAIGLAVVAVALLARGLVPEPAFNTRIGEIPSLSRPLMQQAIIVPTDWERRFVASTGRQAAKPDSALEPAALAEIVPPVPASTGMPADTGADEASRTAYVSPVIWSPAARADPLTELIRAVGAETSDLALPSPQIGVTGRPAAVEPPALAFGVDEPASEDGAGTASAGHGAKPAAAKRQAKAETGAEATAGSKAQTKAATTAKAAVSRPAKASRRAKGSKTKYRRNSVRRGRTTRSSKRKLAARSVVKSTRKKAKRARSSQRERTKKRTRTTQSRARSTGAARTSNRTYFRQPADGIYYRFEPPKSYRYYLEPRHQTNRTNTR